MKYKLVTNFDSREFNNEVNQMLVNGWELYGFPFSIVTRFDVADITSGYAQAFTGADHLEESVEPESLELEFEKNSDDNIPF